MNRTDATQAKPQFANYTEFARWNRLQIVRDGGVPKRAKFDQAGNCTICGESGRCPGYHDLLSDITI